MSGVGAHARGLFRIEGIGAERVTEADIGPLSCWSRRFVVGLFDFTQCRRGLVRRRYP